MDEKIKIYLHMLGELTAEEKEYMFFLQKSDQVNVIYYDPKENIQKEDGAKIILYISDDFDFLKKALNIGRVAIAYLDEQYKEQEKPTGLKEDRRIYNCYAVESLLAIDREYLEKVYYRSKGIPQMIITTERLLIREMAIDDLDDLMEVFDSNEKTEFFEPFYDRREDAKEFLAAYIRNIYPFYDYGIWGIYLKATGRMIGIAGFTPREGAGEKVVLELGYAVSRTYQNCGYAKEACGAVIEYAEEKLEYDKIIKVTKDGVVEKRNKEKGR